MTGPEYARYGGDTTCLLVEGARGEQAVIDVGSGIRLVSRRLGAPVATPLLVLLTHYHLDHLMGLGGFAQLYDPDWRVEFAAPPYNGVGAAEAVNRLLAEPFWPITVADMAAVIGFRDLAATGTGADAGSRTEPLRLGGLEIRWCPVEHPGGCSAFRFDEADTGASLVFATDLEWGISGESSRAGFLALCREPAPARVLVLDAQYTAEQYARHRGWGHSSLRDAVDIAAATSVQRLLVTHHDPTNDDRQLDELAAALHNEMPLADLARQGMEIEL